MNEQRIPYRDNLAATLAAEGYWPARAERLISDDQFAAAIELCRDRLADDPDLLSGRTLYAQALYLAGQHELAAEQCFYVLSLDPDNLVALKYLGDIKYAAGDEQAALSYYKRVLQIDPECTGLKCEVRPRPSQTTRTVTLHRPGESAERKKTAMRIPFYTETIGDLYLNQGHPRLAAEVFRNLHEKNANPRLADKLSRAEKLIKER